MDIEVEEQIVHIYVLVTLPDSNNYLKIKIIILLFILKGQCHEIFYLYLFGLKNIISWTLINRLKQGAYKQAKTVSRTFFVFVVLAKLEVCVSAESTTTQTHSISLRNIASVKLTTIPHQVSVATDYADTASV